jgi:hypothetical protein
MENAQFVLEGALVLLLAATLFHAMRLERALGVLKRDRAVLEELVTGFNESTRAAETGIEKLRVATDGAGRQIARQIDQAQRLKDDLGFLTERGDRLAERLEGGVRSARMYADQHAMNAARPATGPAFGHGGNAALAPPAREDAGGATGYAAPIHASAGHPATGYFAPSNLAPLQSATIHAAPVYTPSEPASGPRLRSEAERDLLRALRAAR